jgi:hypothetical protein
MKKDREAEWPHVIHGSTALGPGLHLSFPVMPTTPEPRITVKTRIEIVPVPEA